MGLKLGLKSGIFKNLYLAVFYVAEAWFSFISIGFKLRKYAFLKGELCKDCLFGCQLIKPFLFVK